MLISSSRQCNTVAKPFVKKQMNYNVIYDDTDHSGKMRTK